MPSAPPPPAYELTCVKLGHRPGCGWYGRFYFDVPLPTICPRCAGKVGERLQIEALPVGGGYQHSDGRRR